MLQKLRDKTSGWIATVILGLLIIPFAFFGIEQYMVQRGENYAAKIDAPPSWWQSAPSWWPISVFWEHEEVAVDEFRTRFEQERQQQRAQQGEAFDAREFESVENKRAILDELINQRIQKLAASSQGVVVNNELVRKTIEEIPAFQVEGKFNPDRYQLSLASQVPPQTPLQFEQRVRESLEESLVATAVAQSNFVTTAEMERLLKLMGETRDASMVMLPPPATDTGAVSGAEIQAWYDKHATNYRAQETVTLEYVELNAAELTVPPPDEAALRQRYEQEKKQFVEQEQRLASHILVRVDEAADAATQEAAKKKAELLAVQAKAPGADFAALARANSDDTGSKESGGDLGWNAKGAMVPAFDAAMFALKPGEISAPVKTEFGWHVIQLREVKGAQQQAFEQARDALLREQVEADRERAFNDISGKVVDLVLKNPSSLAQAASELKLPVQKLGPVARNASEGILAAPAVKRAAFSEAMVQDGTVSDPIEIGANHSVFIRVAAHTPERAQPLAQVREQVIAAVRADRAKQAAEKDADALLARLRAGETLAAVAASRNLPPPEVVPNIPRGAPIPDAAVSEAVFAAAAPVAGKPTPGKTVLADGRIVLFVLDKISPGDTKQLVGPQREMLQQQIAQVGGGDDLKALIAALRKRMKVRVVEQNL
jgi:peptidyl-prolyl cis-trans isomerase D